MGFFFINMFLKQIINERNIYIRKPDDDNIDEEANNYVYIYFFNPASSGVLDVMIFHFYCFRFENHHIIYF